MQTDKLFKRRPGNSRIDRLIDYLLLNFIRTFKTLGKGPKNASPRKWFSVLLKYNRQRLRFFLLFCARCIRLWNG